MGEVSPEPRWINVTAGVDDGEFLTVAAKPGDPLAAFAATEDAVFKTIDGGVTWEEILRLRASPLKERLQSGPESNGEGGAIPSEELAGDFEDMIGDATALTSEIAEELAGDDAWWEEGDTRTKRIPSRIRPSVFIPECAPGDVWVSAGGRLFKSEDGGNSFVEAGDRPAGRGAAFTSVAESCISAGLVFAGATSGIQLSSDSGVTWARATAIPEGCSVNVLVEAEPAILAGTNCGLYKVSLAGSAERVFSSAGKLSNDVLAVALTGDSILAGTRRGIYASPDRGKNWKRLNPDGLGTPEIRGLLVEGSNVVAAARKSVFASADGGKGFSEIGAVPADADVFDISGKPDAKDGLWLATSRGVFRLTSEYAELGEAVFDRLAGVVKAPEMCDAGPVKAVDFGGGAGWLRGLLPSFSVEVTNEEALPYRVREELRLGKKTDVEFSVLARWDFGSLLFESVFLDASKENAQKMKDAAVAARKLSELCRKIRKLRMLRAANPGMDTFKSALMEIEIQKLDALILSEEVSR